MKKFEKTKGFILGILAMLLLFNGMTAIAATPTTKKNVDIYYGYTVYVDGVKFEPTDKNGVIEPFNYNGWIYAPFEHIAKALGKEAYWDSETRTLYLGKTGGKSQQPTLALDKAVNISDYCRLSLSKSNETTDNYGNTYNSAYRIKRNDDWHGSGNFVTLLNQKYSRFKGTFYVPQGTSTNESVIIEIILDGQTIYKSPEITKTSKPISVDLDVSGGNEFTIYLARSTGIYIFIADAGFYQ